VPPGWSIDSPESRAAERVEDQPERPVRLGRQEIAAEHDPPAAPFGDRGARFGPAHMPPHQRTGGDTELAGEMPDTARGAVDQHLATEKQPALTQRVERGEPRDRQCRCLGVADPIGQRRHRMAAAIDPLGPGPRRQDADDPGAGFGAAAVGGGGFEDSGEVPARPPARLGDLERAAGLAAVQRDRADPDRDLVAVGVAQFDPAHGQPPRRGGIDNDGTDLLRH
jgi:hypothetical protein